MQGGAGNYTLLKARRKVTTVVTVGVVLVSSASFITILAAITGFDMDVPLVMYGVVFAYVPLLWLAISIQVHSGRSRFHERLLSPMNSRRLSRRDSPRPGFKKTPCLR